MKLINILKEIRIINVNKPTIYPKDKKWYTTINKDNYKHILDALANDKFAFVPDNLRSKMGDQSFELEDEWLLVYDLESVGIEYIYDEEEFEDKYEKIENNLNEIKIRNINNFRINSNEDLLDFLNQNIKEFIKHEKIDEWYDGDLDALKLELCEGDDNGIEVTWNEFAGEMSYHYLDTEENLPDPGSGEWKKGEFKGVEFWKLYI